MPDRSRYRQINYIGARILEARELNKMQAIDRMEDDSREASGFQLEGMYREGATLNLRTVVSGSTISLQAIDAGSDMLVMVRGCWEKLKVGEIGSLAMSPTNHDVVLNWWIQRITLADDALLLDTTTGEAAAEMGELEMEVATVDTSEVDAGVSLASNQLDKNRHKVVLFAFQQQGGVWVQQALDNVIARAYGKPDVAGLVQLTAGTPGLAVGDSDPRLDDMREPLEQSVWDSKVRIPVGPGGTNADGTDTYDDPAAIGKDKGGISAVKVILVQSKQLLEDGFNWLRSGYNTLVTRYLAHETQTLGLSNTHPMPTAIDVNATPDTHMGLELGITGPVPSHPPVAHLDQGGFRLFRSVDAAKSASDYSYATIQGAAVQSGFTTEGDVYGEKPGAVNADPPVATNQFRGSLGLMSVMATLLKQHVESQGAGSPSPGNPHGQAPSDIGAASVAYVDSSVASGIAVAEGWAGDYTDAAVAALKAGYQSSLTDNGYIILPDWLGGFTIQWGVAYVYYPTRVAFPRPFAHACLRVISSAYNSYYNSTSAISYDQSGFTGNDQHGGNDSWLAVGY